MLGARLLLPTILLGACTSEAPDPREAFAAPDAWPPLTGPGGPGVTDAPVFEHCAYLQGGPGTADHHNLVVPYDGYMLMPWAPEDGGGGITFYDMSVPCEPAKVGEAWADGMRESHTLGFSTVHGRDYAVVNHLAEDGRGGGIGFWDITDVSAPVWVSQLEMPGHAYPDSYLRLTLSVFWQGPWVFVSNGVYGVFIVDASDPLEPQLAGQIEFEGPHLVGSFHVWGNRAMAATAGLGRTVLLDVSDPLAPQPIAGGDFVPHDATGKERFYYFSNVGSRYALFARSEEGGGPIVYDITDQNYPTFVSDHPTEEGDGAYVFQHGDRLFLGDSNRGQVYDFSEPTALVELGSFELKGDLDTVTPYGHMAIVSVDEKANAGQASAVVPWTAEPDSRGPRAGMTSPVHGATFQARTSRIGVVFDEMIEPKTVFSGSFRVWSDAGPVPGSFNVQENIVNFTPDAPLLADTTYTVEVPSGGLTDTVGNPTAETLLFSFSTGASP